MKKVLVVEDNADNLRLLSYALSRAGYEVVWAKTGEEGVELAQQGPYTFIIMDIMLPGIDGTEATKRIRASKADGIAPIIAMTSYAMRGDREIFLGAGMNGYIEKPINPQQVVDQIHRIIAGDES